MAKLKVPYLVLRDGRPRWVPSPELRKRGHKGQDLKDAAGNWLSKSAAMDAAEAINAAIAQAPAAAATPAAIRPKLRTMSALFDTLRASPKWQGGKDDNRKDTGRLAPRTLRDYREHLVLLEKWCGDIPCEALTRADIEQFYFDQMAARGTTRANAIMRTLRIALNYADKLEWISKNRAAKMELVDAGGRLVMFSPEEIAALVGAADYLGLHGMGDAIVLGLLTGQREEDILALPEGDLSQGHYVVKQKKRGAIAYVPQTRPLVARVLAMRERKAQQWPNVKHTMEIIETRSGRAYHAGAKQFRKDFAKVRFVAAGGLYITDALNGDRSGGRNLPFTPQPTVMGKFYSDLRDTAVTILAMAGLTKFEIANITGHSLATVEAILNKHYFVRNAELAASGGAKLDAYFENASIRWA